MDWSVFGAGLTPPPLNVPPLLPKMSSILAPLPKRWKESRTPAAVTFSAPPQLQLAQLHF
ncbi:MAG: hypothetical protein DMG37_23005 [Acidobacteria bacterium]|nr:MAG: hypothetical protein DMG37_23005 [Acidobacteriota bacterium]